MPYQRVIALSLAALVFAPSSALAVSATQDAYGEEGVVTEEPETGGGNTEPTETAGASPSTTSTASLPFTGLETGLIAAAGLSLLGTGVVLRRAARPE